MPLFVGGTILAVIVAGVVIHRMASLDQEMARSAQADPSADLAPASPPAETPPAAVEPEIQGSPAMNDGSSTEPSPVIAESPSMAVETPVEPVASAAPVAEAVPAATPGPEAPPAPAPVAKAEPVPAQVQSSEGVATPLVAKAEAPAPAPIAAPAPPPAAWWPAPRANALNLLYAGYLDDYPAVLLLFDGEFKSNDGLDQAISVTRSDGSKVVGPWRIGPNGRTLILPVPLPGSYHVDVAPILMDTSGQVLGTSLGGPVMVR